MLWIPGCKGLLGSALLSQCAGAIGSGKEVDIGDICSVRNFARSYPLRYIINCAAYSSVDLAETERELSWKVNAEGPKNLAVVAKEVGAKLIHISTDYVFPGTGTVPLTEFDPPAPCNYYGVGKLEGEKRVLSMDGCVVRTSWIFGREGKNFVAQLFYAMQREKEIRLTENQWGRVTYALDLVKALLQIRDFKGLYQYANQGVVNRYEFGLAMRDEMMSLGYKVVTKSIVPVTINSFPRMCKRPVYSALNTEKIEKFLSIRPWKEALREFLCEQLPACL